MQPASPCCACCGRATPPTHAPALVDGVCHFKHPKTPPGDRVMHTLLHLACRAGSCSSNTHTARPVCGTSPQFLRPSPLGPVLGMALGASCQRVPRGTPSKHPCTPPAQGWPQLLQTLQDGSTPLGKNAHQDPLSHPTKAPDARTPFPSLGTTTCGVLHLSACQV